MKKVLIIAITLALAISLFGCKNNADGAGNGNSTVSISRFLKAGKIPEADYGIGTQISLLENYYADYLKRQDSGEYIGEGEEVAAFVDEGNTAYYIINNCSYYYNPENAGKGVSCIVNLSDAFGFETGITTLDFVKSSITDLKGEEYSTDSARELFFLFMSISDAKTLRYFSGDYELKFIFENDILIATTLTDTKNFVL